MSWLRSGMLSRDAAYHSSRLICRGRAAAAQRGHDVQHHRAGSPVSFAKRMNAVVVGVEPGELVGQRGVVVSASSVARPGRSPRPGPSSAVHGRLPREHVVAETQFGDAKDARPLVDVGEQLPVDHRTSRSSTPTSPSASRRCQPAIRPAVDTNSRSASIARLSAPKLLRNNVVPGIR